MFARAGRSASESRIRYRSISPGTGSGALLRFLYFIPPGSGPIKSALQYACRGTRLAFRTWPRAHVRRLDARAKKKEVHGKGWWMLERGETERKRDRTGERTSLLYFGKKSGSPVADTKIGLRAGERFVYYMSSVHFRKMLCTSQKQRRGSRPARIFSTLWLKRRRV